MFIALCSVKASPGVTTTTVALAVRWPGTAGSRRLVAEVDPAGGDLAMRFGLAATRGLVGLAAAARHTSDPAVVWQHAQPLTGDVVVLAGPPGGSHARTAVHTLATAPGGPLLDAAGREAGAVVLADCGRMDPGSPAEAIARRADALVLVAGTHGDDLAHAAARLDELARWTPRPCLLLSGCGYATGEVERELGVPTIGRLPHDPAAAATLAGRRPTVARRRSGGLARAVTDLAHTLAAPAAPNPARPAPSGVPGVPAQLVAGPGRNGHQPITAVGKEPLA